MIHTDFRAPFALPRISFPELFGQRFAFAVALLVAASIGLRSVASPTATLQTVALSGQPIPGVGGQFPSNYHPTAFLQPTINNSGQILFLGGLPPAFSSSAIFAGTPGNLRLVAAPNMVAPDAGTGIYFNMIRTDSPLSMNEDGTVAFVASLKNADGFDRGLGIWRQDSGGPLTKVAQLGDQLPNAPAGVQYTGLERPQLNGEGSLSILFGSNSSAFGHSGYLTFSPTLESHFLIRNGVAAPGIPGGTLLDMRLGTTGNDFYIHALVEAPTAPFSSERFAAVWRGDSYDSLQLSYYGRNPAPNVPGFLKFAFGPFSVFSEATDAGYVAAVGRLEARDAQGSLHAQSGLFVLQPDGAIRTVAVTNAHPPGTPVGSFYSSDFFGLEINEAGHVAYNTSIALPGEAFQRRAIFAEGPNGILALVASQDSPAPGTPAGVTFNSDIFPSEAGDVFSPPAYNNRGQVAFLGEVQGPGVNTENEVGLWGTDRRGVLTLLAREGSPLEIAPGVFRTIAELFFVGGKGDAQNLYTGLNDGSQVLFSARFTDGTSGLFITDALALPEPTCAALLGLAIAALLGTSRNRP